MANQAFQWTGIDRHGKRVSGVTQCAEQKDAEQELKRKNIDLISIKLKKQIQFSVRRKKVKRQDILLFTRYLSTMVAAGLPILQALDIISRDQNNPAMRDFVTTLRHNTASGKTLAESFQQYPQYFDELYCSLIKAGEKSGTLDKILIRIATYLEKSEALRRKVKKAMIYPAAVITVAVVVSLVLLIFVVPQFEGVFHSFGAELPPFTKAVIGLSNVMRQYWWILLSILLPCIFFFKKYAKENEKVAEQIDKYTLKLAIVGPMLQKSIIARFSRTLAITLEAGMPIIEAMRSMADLMGNRLYVKAIRTICDDIASGNQLNISMAATGLFPTMVIQMTSIGEASGSLSDMLNKIADYYEDDVNTIVDNLSGLLEPLIMAVLGVIVGGFVVAMYLPIFKLGSIF